MENKNAFEENWNSAVTALRDWNRSADIAARITEAAQKEKQENLRRKEK